MDWFNDRKHWANPSWPSLKQRQEYQEKWTQFYNMIKELENDKKN